MSDKIIEVWEISAVHDKVALHLPDTSNLDSVTRQLPDGYYSTFRTFDGKQRVIGLKLHLDRLYAPCRNIQLDPAISERLLRQALKSLLAEFPAEETRVRISIDKTHGRVFVMLEPLILPPLEVYTKGVRLITVELKRSTPLLKSTAFIDASQAIRAEINRCSAYEALLVQNDLMLEGVTSNFFYVCNGILGTAGKGVLHGITRRMVLKAARQMSIPIRYRALRKTELEEVEEAFISSSSRGIVPVKEIDGIQIGSSRPGAFTEHLMRTYQDNVYKWTVLI